VAKRLRRPNAAQLAALLVSRRVDPADLDRRVATRFDVQAVSRPVEPLARLFSPVAHRLQDSAVRRYLAAMARAVSSGA
jgi:uncharacterized protein (UPF0548 family)